MNQYVVPKVLTSPELNNEGSFLLVNNEFLNDTILNGFELFAAENGTINIKVSLLIQQKKVQIRKYKHSLKKYLSIHTPDRCNFFCILLYFQIYS